MIINKLSVSQFKSYICVGLLTLILTACASTDKQTYSDYQIEGQNILYGNKKDVIPNADVHTFENLEFSYGKDRYHGFYRGKAIPLSDPKTFQVLSENYSKDKNNVYYRSYLLKGADSRTFRYYKFNSWLLKDFGFGKDKSICYIDYIPQLCKKVVELQKLEEYQALLKKGVKTANRYVTEEHIKQLIDTRFKGKLLTPDLLKHIDLSNVNTTNPFKYAVTRNALFPYETAFVQQDKFGKFFLNVYSPSIMGYAKIDLLSNAKVHPDYLKQTRFARTVLEQSFSSNVCRFVLGECSYKTMNKERGTYWKKEKVTVHTSFVDGIWYSKHIFHNGKIERWQQTFDLNGQLLTWYKKINGRKALTYIRMKR